jgi:hypothetical protein
MPLKLFWWYAGLQCMIFRDFQVQFMHFGSQGNPSTCSDWLKSYKKSNLKRPWISGNLKSKNVSPTFELYRRATRQSNTHFWSQIVSRSNNWLIIITQLLQTWKMPQTIGTFKSWYVSVLKKLYRLVLCWQIFISLVFVINFNSA